MLHLNCIFALTYKSYTQNRFSWITHGWAKRTIKCGPRTLINNARMSYFVPRIFWKTSLGRTGCCRSVCWLILTQGKRHVFSCAASWSACAGAQKICKLFRFAADYRTYDQLWLFHLCHLYHARPADISFEIPPFKTDIFNRLILQLWFPCGQSR